MRKKSNRNESISALKGEEKARAKEFLLGTIIFIIGCGMLFFLFSGSSANIAYEDENFQSIIPQLVKHDQKKDKNRIFRRMSPDWVKYSSDFKTFSPVYFKLRSYDSKAKYVFDFGDGIQKNCNKGSINHYYRRAGQYKVTVTVSDDSHERETWTQSIRIKDGMQIDPAAYREY